jgi:hypothetical protein
VGADGGVAPPSVVVVSGAGGIDDDAGALPDGVFVGVAERAGALGEPRRMVSSDPLEQPASTTTSERATPLAANKTRMYHSAQQAVYHA